MSDHTIPAFAPVEMHFPLAGLQHQVAGVSLSVPAKRYLLMLRGDQSRPDFQDWFNTYFDAPCPKVQETVRRNGLCVYWQGPDQLLLAWDSYDLCTAWHEKLANNHPPELAISLIELSDYYGFISLKGERAFDVLRQGCPFDFQQLQPGQAISSIYEKANIGVDYVAEGWLDVMVRISFADYLWQHLIHASNQLHSFSAQACVSTS